MAKYTASLTLQAFTGIDESGGAHNINMNVAAVAQNCNTENGVLRPASGFEPVYPTLPDPIVTLCSFYRRNHEVEAERRVLVAATETALYAFVEGASDWVELINGMTSGTWSWVTYEATRDNSTPADLTDDYVTDILILSNASDGMVVVYGDTLEAEEKTAVPKFATLERHAERIWGIGIEGEPDNLYYSQPYSPFEWGLVYDPVDGTTVLPEQSGGVIQMPTWDGDRFIAIKRFSNNLLAFKGNTAFYIRGLTTGEFAAVEAYGSDGIMAPKTILTDGPAAYYLADGGIGAFDGDTAQLLDNNRLHSVFGWLGVLDPALPCAIVSKHVIYMALPVGAMASETVGGVTRIGLVEPTRNNTLVEYDTRRKTYMVRTGIQADALHNHGGRLLFTSGDDPYQVFELTGTTYNTEPVPVKWHSAWQDLGAKNTVKSGFVIHITGLSAVAAQNITVGIETERKLKTRIIPLSATFEKTRFPISNTGRRFRLIIEANSEVEWEIDGGVQIDMEIDED